MDPKHLEKSSKCFKLIDRSDEAFFLEILARLKESLKNEEEMEKTELILIKAKEIIRENARKSMLEQKFIKIKLTEFLHD